MFESLRGICDYNESYFAWRAMLIELQSAIFSNKSATEYTGRKLDAALLIKKLIPEIVLQNFSLSLSLSLSLFVKQ